MNVGLAVSRNAVKNRDALAVFDPQGDISYGELDDRTNRLANLFRNDYGVDVGDRIALMVANRREVVEVLVAASKDRATYVGLNFRQDESDLREVFRNSTPKLLITDDSHLAKIGDLAAEFSVPLLNINDSSEAGYEARIKQGSGARPQTLEQASPKDDFCIVYTSGTTGKPKGVHFDQNAAAVHALVAIMEYELDSESRYLIQIPHNSSVNITMVPVLMAGGALGFADSRGFDPETFAATVERERITHSFVVPTMLFRVLEHDVAAERLKSLKTLGYGSSPIPPERLEQLITRYGPIFNQLYGMAEIASIGTILSKQDHLAALETHPELLASAGRPSYAVTVRVIDAEGHDVATGEVGEVVFGGPHVMKGYFRDPERTEEAMHDGWMHSGDIGRFDDNGYLYIVDRMKDIIIRGGYNIAPREIEDTLYTHPGVLEASVVGIPDPEWGEAVCAFVALKSGHTVTEEELVAWCRNAGLGSIKVPQSIRLMHELPKSPVGKILKRDLRETMWQGDRKV
jgi:fatty-acyl-CoA synthase/long-chain acyl-CoA synthetase